MNSLGGYRPPTSRKSIASGDIVPKGQRLAQVQNYTPQQLQQHEQMFQHVGPDSYLARLAGGDESMFEQLEAPAWRQFQQAQGQLASRFSGQGMGGRNSSGFQNAAGQLGSDFAMNLQAQRMNMRNQALRELMGYSDALLNQKPYDKALYQKQQKQNPWAEMAGKFAGAIPGLAAAFMGGGSPESALQGASSIFGGTTPGGGSYSGYSGGPGGSGGISTSSALNPLLF